MAALKGDPPRRDAKPDDAAASPLARVMREFEELVLSLEMGLRQSLEDADPEHEHEHEHAHDRTGWQREDIRHEACRLAIAELKCTYTRKQIRRSLNAAEAHGKRLEDRLHAVRDNGAVVVDDGELRSIHNGYFRLYSPELFDMLGQPTNLRFGTLRFHTHPSHLSHASERRGHDSALQQQPIWVSVELALHSSFFVADSLETLPYHTFKMPQAPSLQNRGILSRKPEDNGAFPEYDSWLLFTFLGNGCLKLEVPIEMCADVYGGPLAGRENEEVLFWGVFVEDDGP